MDNTIKYVKEEEKEKDIFNIFEIRKNIPDCLKNIFNKCKITLDLYNKYDITTIEKNLNTINKIYKDLISSKDISYSPFYTQIAGLVLKGKWIKTDNIKGENLEIKIDHDKKIKSYINDLDNVIEYLGKDKKIIKEMIINIKEKKCENYCTKNREKCENECKNKLNRFDVLISILTTYQLIFEKLNYDYIKRQMDFDISEIEKDIDNLDNKNKDKMFIKYKDSINLINKNLDKKIEVYTFNRDTLKKIKENKINYYKSFKNNYYDNCLKSIESIESIENINKCLKQI
jgi:hypothetical protein